MNDEPLISINIQITNDDIAKLKIYEGDDIEKNVKKFCREHNLPSTAENIINQQVMNELDNQINECKI